MAARKFAEMPGSDAEKAVRYGVTVPTINRWKSGARTPADDAVISKIEADGGPLRCEWEEFPPEVSAPPLPDFSAEATPTTVQAEANRLLALVQAGMTEASTEPDVSRRMGILANGANIVRQLGRVVGAGHVVTERQILESPHMRLIRDRIIAALEPWPEALAAVATALESP